VPLKFKPAKAYLHHGSLSISVSVVAILQLTMKVISYAKETKDAPKEQTKPFERLLVSQACFIRSKTSSKIARLYPARE
jgi:hypothetical protein